MASCNARPPSLALHSGGGVFLHLLLLGIIASPLVSAMVDVPLDCKQGWTLVGSQCYRAYTDVLPWQSADKVCNSYGSHLARIKDYYENGDIGKFAQTQGVSEYWIGGNRGVNRLTANSASERLLLWSDDTESNVAVGYWSTAQPEANDGRCVLVKRETSGKVLWQLAPCERKSPYICQRPAAPAGSFHCLNGRFVRMGLTCDGDDDCGDGSDELNCPTSMMCSYSYKQQSGTVQSENAPNSYLNNKTCIYTIEVSLGYNVKLQFTKLNTEPRSDVVRVLAGGLTVSTSEQLARLSGDYTNALPTYISNNNFMMIIFTTDENVVREGFIAQYSAVKDTAMQPRNYLEATNTEQELKSPFYDQNYYLGSQDYTWIITAKERVKIVTLMIMDVDLKGDDKILIRDGDMVYDTLLATLTSDSTSIPPYVLTTGRNLYITMQTRGVMTGKGFRFRYWQGCDVTSSGESGEIHSPGYRPTGGEYGAYQVCTYRVTIPSGKTVTLRFNSMRLHPSDEIMLYENNVLLYNITGTNDPGPIAITSGSFRVVFDSDAILTSEGFSLSYSVDCPNPGFNNNTNVNPSLATFTLGTKLTVSCKTGYGFAALEYQDRRVQDGFSPVPEVDMTCGMGGKWDKHYLPLCEPKYCGQAPAVTNAYVVSSTGPTYSYMVRYQCYPGFAMTGQETIVCQADGTWTARPSCQTASCQLLPASINNGNRNISSGDGTIFSSIVEYICGPGYQIVGDPVLFCKSDGTWSASVPTCQAVQCFVPYVRNGKVQKGGVSVAGSVISYGAGPATAFCDTDYMSTVPGGGTSTVTCQSDRTITGLDGFQCVYKNKCQTPTTNPCSQMCHDSEFEPVTCSCLQGYTLNVNGFTCDEINECALRTDGCDHYCNNAAPGYTCLCDNGYVLFTETGDNQGFTLAPNEDGRKAGDVRRYNHSCVPRRCPMPPAVANGNLMSHQDNYYYQDFIEYTCNLGFELVGNRILKCQANGQWNYAAPVCNRAVCLHDDIPTTLRNPAIPVPSGSVDFGAQVTLMCNVPGKAPYNKTRTCIYYQNRYLLSGADYSCPLIDCGDPYFATTRLASVQFSGLDTSNTTYGSSFQFGCQNLYTVRGTSSNGDTTVRCDAQGRWGFGTLRCEGVTCTDPGRPADGRQVVGQNQTTISYDQGSLVYFTCDRTGFTLNNPYPIQCVLNTTNNGLAWNTTVPMCIDTTSPTTTTCPGGSITTRVPLYGTASSYVTVPSYSDNVAVYKTRVTNLGGVVPLWPNSAMSISRMTVFSVRSQDHAGNAATCDIVTQIIDDIPPVITCPQNMVREFRYENENLQVSFSASDVTVTDNVAVNFASLSFSPTNVAFSATQAVLYSTFPPFRDYRITASVRDTSNMTSECQFDLVFRPATCSPMTIRTPMNGQKVCTNRTDTPGFTCTLTCTSGYAFYEEYNSTNLTYQCQDGSGWNIPKMPRCTQANLTSQHSRYRQKFRFTFAKSGTGTCTEQTYRTTLQGAFDASEAQLPNACTTTNQADRVQGQLTIDPGSVVELGNSVTMIVSLTWDQRTWSVYDTCATLISLQYQTTNIAVTNPIVGVQFQPLECPAFSTQNAAQYLNFETFCDSGKKIQYQQAGYNRKIDVCVRCPEGTQQLTNVCQECTEGHYNPTAGSSTCDACSGTASTFRTGAANSGECTAKCPAGTYSATGLPPCMTCARNSYSSMPGSTTCTPCGGSNITRSQGATMNSQCIPVCPIGTYNAVDGHGIMTDCRACPRGFYANSTGLSKCLECSTSDTTRATGSSSQVDCIQDTGCNATNNPCRNGGSCTYSDHSVVCNCPDGYNGQYCDVMVSPCASSPCYNGGGCTVSLSQYNCSCIAGTSGPRCETVAKTCTADYCLNGGFCRNELNAPFCVCRPGFSGTRCETSQPICQSTSCFNGGTCVAQDNIRFYCNCPTGFTGPQCQTNINDCASNPCLHGGNCTDLVNGFQCSCPTGFSGLRCEVRQNLCSSNQCGSGQCVADYMDNTYRCVCPEGFYSGTVTQYEAWFGFELNASVAVTFAYNATNVTIETCMAQCKIVSCIDFVYNTANGACKVNRPGSTLSIDFGGSSVYFYRNQQQVEDTYWTPWYDSYYPGTGANDGDIETLQLLDFYGLNICNGEDPVDVQCQTVNRSNGQAENVTCRMDPADIRHSGLMCNNSEQSDGRCQNYEVRFKCLSWKALSQSTCQDINYCQNTSTCRNGGACTDTLTQPSCSCPTGYTGSLCQHNVDDCINNPCFNNGTCTDAHMGFTCQCLPGFTGSSCGTNINECSPSPCSLQGTDSCQDLVNGSRCICKPGYTGQLCETNINECASNPCFHMGICNDMVNGFNCTCKAGWTGNLCQDKVQSCLMLTCANGAMCKNLFNDYYCNCLPNTYGKTCSNAPSICQNANPCLHSSSCSESQGSAQCSCTPAYTGSGCELRREVCSENSSVCQNGATCMYTSLTNYTCTCPPGYTGRYCETNINDCTAGFCPSTATCIDMVNTKYCRCPVGLAGDNCQKEVNRDFDLLFTTPDKTNMAALGYPVRLMSGGFTVTMWVQFLNKGGMGTFFTLYSVRDRNSLANKKELIRLDETGVTVSLNGSSIMLNTTVDYHMDGEWHYIVLSWNQTNGLFSFFVDTVRIPLHNYLTGQNLDLYTWMVLGCDYDESDEMCVEGRGFNGYISQVSLYSRELLFREELTIRGNVNPLAIFPDALMTWGEFLLYPGVKRTTPSMADRACPRGFTGFPACTTIIPAKTPVTVEGSCPRDMIIDSQQRRITSPTWNNIVFKGQATSVRQSYTSGTAFLWGKYPVVVVAASDIGNQALCTFDIFIQYSNCTTPATPLNAQAVFAPTFEDEKGRMYKQASATCNTNYDVVVPSPKIHTCGPVGSWDPTKMYLPYTLAPCGLKSVPKRRLIVTLVYHVPSVECAEISQEVRERLLQQLVLQNQRWSGAAAPARLCQLPDCTDLQLNITCSTPTTGRRKRQTVTNQDVQVIITADNVPNLLTLSTDPGVTRSPEDLMQQLVLSDIVFDFKDYIADATPDPNGLQVVVELLCQAPLALIGTSCVECAPGSYYDSSMRTCNLCPIGSYQDMSSQTSCTPCAPGTTTESVGSTSGAACKIVCPVGQYYSHTANHCMPCPQGFYQNVTGFFYCLPCPVDKTTRLPGATAETQCFNDCPPGQELAVNGSCVDCPIGQFKPADQTLCGACPAGLVTNYTGADSQADCNVADNQAGYIRNPLNQTQSVPCPIGTYQPNKWQYTCISCGGSRYRTDSMGSTSLTDCKFFCPAGQEQIGLQELCQPCEIGKYRTGDNPYSACEGCPNNLRTMSTGSTNVSACTIYKCQAGYRPKPNVDACDPCPRGTYQPQPDQTDCIACTGAMMDTRTTGSTMLSQCERYCPSGQEKAANGTCITCPIGYFKNNAIDNFSTCTRCSDTRYVTGRVGAVAQTECTVRDCSAGYKITNSTTCEACPQGSYQDMPYQTSCIQCASGQSTRQNASKLASDCETFCTVGKEKINGSCVTCERGFYKNNDNNVFMPCTMCPLEYVTQSIGSAYMSQCTVRNCTAGSYIITLGGNQTCDLCKFGTYQPYNWQTACLPCGTDRTTTRNGAVNETECILSCPAGKENKPNTDTCTACEQGFYKGTEGATRCTACPTGTVTRVNGSILMSECDLRACMPGQFADPGTPGGCKACIFGEYQPMKWQEQCIPCTSGFTTYVRGAVNSTQCLRDCLPGFGLNMMTQTCTLCPIGYYNDDMDPEKYMCTLCNTDFITNSTGAANSAQCNIRNCTTPGHYLDSTANVCRECARGTWQNQKWQKSCISCDVGYTTRYTGSSMASECLYDCPSGEMLNTTNNNNNCYKCPKGMYRNRGESWECQECPDGVTTAGTGATTRSECSVSECPVGQFFNNEVSVQRCQTCQKDYYQDEAGQFVCKPCPTKTGTVTTGSNAASQCLDRCQIQTLQCNINGACVSTATGVQCRCKEGYVGDGTTCTHVCDQANYCLNAVRCDRDTLKCICKDNYLGTQCETKQDPSVAAALSEKDTIITAVVTSLAFLLFVIAIAVCCCVMYRRRQRRSSRYHDTSDERASIATGGYDPFNGGYHTKPPSLGQGPRMMLPAQQQQMYENPTYTVSDGDPAVYKV